MAPIELAEREGRVVSEREYDCEKWVVKNEPCKFVAFERPRAGSSQPPIVNLRWWLPEEKRYAKKSLGVRVRGSDGSLDSEKIAAMLELAGRKAKRVLAGKTWEEAPEARETAPKNESLTLAEGFRLALEKKYRTHNKHRYEVTRVARDVIRIFGADATWDVVDSDVIAVVVEKLAAVRRGEELWEVKGSAPDENDPEDDREPRYRTVGWTWGQMILTVLYAVGRWLEDKKEIPRGTCDLPHRWKRDLKTAWMKETGESTRKSRPRHTDEELAKLYRALPEAHPLVRLGFELGAEYREGQVARGKRSHLNLARVGAYKSGTFEVIGPENKPGAFQHLTPEQRDVVLRLLAPDGLLGLLEAAYQAGDIRDYSLFPQYALSYPDGQIPADAGDEHVDPRTMIRHFHALEEIAGVDHVPGRAWYGVRRRLADMAPRYTPDERVLNDIGGWLRTATRQGYQQDENPEVRAETARVRRQSRADLLSSEKKNGGQPICANDAFTDSGRQMVRSLFRSFAQHVPERALAILRGDEDAALGEVPVDELLAVLEPADLVPLLQGGSEDAVVEAIGVLMRRNGSAVRPDGA